MGGSTLSWRAANDERHEAFFPLAGLVGIAVAALVILMPVAATIVTVTALLLGFAWLAYLEKYRDQVSPEGIYTRVPALYAGWALISIITAVLLLVVLL